jgi:hypothetical protein
MRPARAAVALAAAGLAFAAPAPALAAQTTTQRFFAQRLLEDDGTSREVRDLLRTNQGFVDKAVAFKDLTGDRKADATVRVQSGGASGAIALYVLSTDTGRRNSGLEVVFRSQELLRAETRIRDGVLRYRSARPQPGDERGCPSRLSESRLRWRERRHRFEVIERREVAPTDPWGDQLAVTSHGGRRL